MSQSWLKLELLAERIYRELSPDAIVKHNDQLWGNDSGTYRQIDVSIQSQVAGHRILVVVQAKAYSRAVNVVQVGEFASVIKDVRATKGVMVCNKGYSKSAITYARNRGIDLCSAFDVETRTWAGDLKLPVVLRHYDIETSLGGTYRANQTWCLTGDVFFRYTFNGQPLGLHQDFIRLWNDGTLDRTPDKWHKILCGQPGQVQIEAFLPASNHLFTGTIDQMSLEYHVEERNYLKYCEPEEYRGLKNHSTSSLLISAFSMQIPINIQRDGWIRIDDPKAIVVDECDTVVFVSTRMSDSAFDGECPIVIAGETFPGSYSRSSLFPKDYGNGLFTQVVCLPYGSKWKSEELPSM